MSDNLVICPKCNEEIGQTVVVNGLLFFRTGRLLIRTMSAVCLQCGSVVYWSVSDKAIERMIKAGQVIINIQ